MYRKRRRIPAWRVPSFGPDAARPVENANATPVPERAAGSWRNRLQKKMVRLKRQRAPRSSDRCLAIAQIAQNIGSLQQGGGGASTSLASIALRPSPHVSLLKSTFWSVCFSACAHLLRLQKSSK